jgi:hypothetical protein
MIFLQGFFYFRDSFYSCPIRSKEKKTMIQYPIEIVARGEETVAALMEEEELKDGKVLFGYGGRE